MSDARSPNRDRVDEPEVTTGDPDKDSTWGTIDNTVDVEEVMNEEDLENFLVEPILDPLETSPDRDESQDPQAPLIPHPEARFEAEGEP